MSKKIAFMGTPTISGQILKSLYQNGFDIEVVYTQPPVASNRGHRLNKSPVHIMAEILNIPIRTPIVFHHYVKHNLELYGLNPSIRDRVHRNENFVEIIPV